MSSGLFLVVRTLHILAGILWVGGAVVAAGFILPAVIGAGPAGGAVMRQLVQVRRLPVFLMSSAGIAILSGAALMWHDAWSVGSAWFQSPFGRALSIGAALGVGALLLGSMLSAPTAKRLGQLAATQGPGTPPDAATAAEMQRLQQRLSRAGQIVAILVLLAAAAMASARYL